ncbi:MAG: leucine-rich repeat protein, partial [Clostridia bacterium]|nr:leucine-rich repeat protein [Clostridia bacterium]
MKKNLFSKTLSLILALTTVFGLFIFSPAASADTSGDWTYTVSEGKATITGYKGSNEDITIPSVIGGYSVNKIGDSAFYNNSSLRSVIIPEGVETIGWYSFFRCSFLSSVIIPSSVRQIGLFAFYECTSLTSVVIPDGVESILDDAFDGCTSLSDLTLGKNVKWISRGGFSSCTSLKEVRFPDSLESLGPVAFAECTSLEKITIPKNVKSMVTPFTGCSSLMEFTVVPENQNFSSADGMLLTKDGSTLIDCPTAKSKVKVPDRVKNIGMAAFSYNGVITDVSLPDSVERIEDDAFSNCDLLENVVIPDSVSSIGKYAFANCRSLQTIVIPSSTEEIGEKAFGYYNRLNNEYFSDYFRLGGFTVYGYEGSAAQTYAEENEFWFVNEEIGPHEHAYTDKNASPSCTECGYKAHTCTICGFTYADEFYDALGHDFGTDHNAWKCSRCGEKNPDYKPTVNFKDVPAGAYYADAVAWAVANGITTGTSDTTFSPNDGCTRGQVVAFLWRAAGSPEPRDNKNPFSDVKSNAYYYKAVLWAVENEVTSGTDATHFSPNSVCTRGQIVTFLWRANGKPAPSKTANPFKDVKASDYYYDAVLWAVEKDITLGT